MNEATGHSGVLSWVMNEVRGKAKAAGLSLSWQQLLTVAMVVAADLLAGKDKAAILADVLAALGLG